MLRTNIADSVVQNDNKIARKLQAILYMNQLIFLGVGQENLRCAWWHICFECHHRLCQVRAKLSNSIQLVDFQIECRPHYSFHKSNVSKQTIDCLVVLAIVFLQGVGHFKALEQFSVVKVNAFRFEHLLGMWQKDLWFAWQKLKIN